MDTAKETENDPDGSQLPPLSCLSMKSGASMEYPLCFRKHAAAAAAAGFVHVCSGLNIFTTTDNMSLKTDHNGNKTFFCHISSADFDKSGLPASSCLSLKSDASMEYPLHFKMDTADGYV